MNDSLGKYLVAKVRTQEGRCVQINPSANQLGELLLDAKEAEAGPRARLELDQHIDIAFGAKVAA
ncbi:MAG TPA: hypothetical protein VHZ24_07465 [Pirellulales bacterium]|nr:hypothetical protein [Pirellulales bacterium]